VRLTRSLSNSQFLAGTQSIGRTVTQPLLADPGRTALLFNYPRERRSLAVDFGLVAPEDGSWDRLTWEDPWNNE